MKKHIFLLVLGLVVASTGVDAKNQGKLPKGATPMTPEEITVILSGNSIDFKVAKYYFAPDHSLLGIGSNGWFADGTWSVNGNTWCLDSLWHGPDKAKAPETFGLCSEKYKVGKIIYTKNTKGEDKYLGDIWTGEEKKIKKGDIVSAKVAKLKQKYGY